MKTVIHAALAAAGILAQCAAAQADKLDLVLQRLDALEQSNAKLVKENAALRERLNRVESTKGGVATDSKVSKTNAVGQSVHGQSQVDASQAAGRAAWTEIDANGHGFLEHKVGAPLTFYTPGGEITGYGNLDASIDITSKNVSTLTLNGSTPPVGNFGWMPAISTNISYLGVRGFQRISDFPFNFVYQFEVGMDISATPGLRETNSNLSNTVNGALFNRNTFIGFSSPILGAFKVGKTDAPYKNSTAAFNPFAGELGDYAVVMGNTGGDNRVEFGTRLDHAVWYESPSWGGFQLNVLYAPGQNRSTDSSDLAAGESDCAGGNTPQSGGDLPIACNDGGFSDAVSANLSYTNGPFYATAAYERHEKVNRQSDITAIFGTAVLSGLPQSLFDEDVAAEDAFKVGALYHFPTHTTVGAIFESMHRYLPADLEFQNERTRNGTWVFVSQDLTPTDSVHLGWAHAFQTPGDPGQHNDSTLTTVDGGTFAPNNNQADMVTAAYKKMFSPNLTWYVDVAATFNGPSAHYDLGAGGRSVTTDCHDAFGADGGFASTPHCYTGTTLVGASTGVQWRF